MMQRWYQFLCLLLLIAVASTPPAVAANGKIVGIVRDASTKDVIPGANVLVVGTTLGGAADAQGRYYILNVPPGSYALQASAVGYGKLKIEDVNVVLDQTVEMNITLRGQDVQIGEMVITAERRVVDKNRTSTKTTVTSDEIQNLPTVSTIDLMNTSPSAFNGFVRGGRITETKTIVEGVDVSNQFYENAQDQTNQAILQSSFYLVRHSVGELNSTADMTNLAVEQFSLNTGATGADIQSATAGTINYSLKEGAGPLSGSFQARLSQPNGLSHAGPDVYNLDQIYFNDKNTTNARLAANRQSRDSLNALHAPIPGALTGNITSDSIRSGKYVYTPGRYINQSHPLLDFSGSIGGDITDAWRFFLTGRFLDSHGYYPNERNRAADITLKTSYNITNAIKLNAFGVVNDKGKLFGWKNTSYDDDARYFLEGVPQNQGLDYVASLKVTHVLTPATFYEVQVSQTYHNLVYGFTDGNGDGYCSLNESGDFLQMADTASISKYISQAGGDLSKFFRIGDEAGPSQIGQPLNIANRQANFTRPQFIYENTKAIARTVRGDLTSQVDYHHQIKAGFLFSFKEISQIQRNTMLGADGADSRSRLIVDNWNFFPTEMSVYASDRMEFGGLVINLGLRGDRWDPKAADFANYYNAYKPDTIMIDGQMRRANVNIRGQNVAPSYFVSPRIGVSHPISETAALFYSYSRQAIPPPYSRMYSSYYTMYGISLPNFVSVGAPLTKSSNYELGAQWEFLPGKLGLNFTAYMRDVENYSPQTSTINLPGGASVWYFQSQYADARGVELSLQAARQKYLDFMTVSGRVNYAYTYVKASGWTGSNSVKTNVTTFNSSDSVKYGNTLPFNDFVYYNKVQNNVAGGASTLTGGYDRTHRVTYLLTLEFPMDFILSSLGTFQSGFFYPINSPQDSRVAGRTFATAPWNKMVDVRLEKGFRFGNMRFAVFAEVKNFFNWTNIIGYDNTISGASLWEATNSGNGTTLTNPYYANTVATGPDPTGQFKRSMNTDGSWFYDIPREYYFGVRVDL